MSEIFYLFIAVHVKLGLPLGSHRTQHASCVLCEERLENIFIELWKTSSHPGLNWGPLTLAVSALPPESMYTESTYNACVNVMCILDYILYKSSTLHIHSTFVCMHICVGLRAYQLMILFCKV